MVIIYKSIIQPYTKNFSKEKASPNICLYYTPYSIQCMYIVHCIYYIVCYNLYITIDYSL